MMNVAESHALLSFGCARRRAAVDCDRTLAGALDRATRRAGRAPAASERRSAAVRRAASTARISAIRVGSMLFERAHAQRQAQFVEDCVLHGFLLAFFRRRMRRYSSSPPTQPLSLGASARAVSLLAAPRRRRRRRALPCSASARASALMNHVFADVPARWAACVRQVLQLGRDADRDLLDVALHARPLRFFAAVCSLLVDLERQPGGAIGEAEAVVFADALIDRADDLREQVVDGALERQPCRFDVGLDDPPPLVALDRGRGAA